MADRRTKNYNYGTTAIIVPKLRNVNTGEYEQPDTFTVVLKKGSTTIDTWVAGVDDEIVEVLDDSSAFKFYQIYIDTELFLEPCEAVVTMTAEYNTTPEQTIVGKARLIIS